MQPFVRVAHFFGTNVSMKLRRNRLRFTPDFFTAASKISFSCLEIAMETYTVFFDRGIAETYQSLVTVTTTNFDTSNVGSVVIK